MCLNLSDTKAYRLTGQSLGLEGSTLFSSSKFCPKEFSLVRVRYGQAFRTIDRTSPGPTRTSAILGRRFVQQSGNLIQEKCDHLWIRRREGVVQVFPKDSMSKGVVWGRISMIDAERRLLTSALRDPENQQFVLLSDSCVPLRSFDYMYNYMMYSNVSNVDCFDDPGPHGIGRHMDHMLPEIPKEDFRKGSQWFSMTRQHAVMTMADSLYYSKFRDYCGPGVESNKNCIADEHYLPTFFYMLDPGGIANWTLTYVDWSEGKWHPRTFMPEDVSHELLKNLTVLVLFTHYSFWLSFH
ncbi:hypothetical protein F2Q69_00054933 [Brassica cretica]|uniref:Uncharacterized protein n=1 Tax=Brassica cretica TaxID=69181 RepID=A0A8S9MVK0_BRACR|nr:hypothetical protein F2Q69_00054933 [Brassica cretica]